MSVSQQLHIFFFLILLGLITLVQFSTILLLAVFGAVAILSISYGMMLKLTREIELTPKTLAFIIGLPILLSIFIPIQPNSDIFRLLWDGLIQRYDRNPYLSDPTSLDLMLLREEPLYEYVKHYYFGSNQSPLFLIIANFLAIIYKSVSLGSALILAKSVVGLSILFCGYFLYSQNVINTNKLIAIALNPLTLYAVSQANLDFILFPVLLISWHFYKRSDFINAALIYGLTLHIHPIFWITIAILVIKDKPLLRYLPLALVTYFLWWLPFLDSDGIYQFILTYFSIPHLHSLLFDTIQSFESMAIRLTWLTWSILLLIYLVLLYFLFYKDEISNIFLSIAVAGLVLLFPHPAMSLIPLIAYWFPKTVSPKMIALYSFISGLYLLLLYNL